MTLALLPTTAEAPVRCLVVDSPVGPLRVVATPEAVTAIEFHPFADGEVVEEGTPLLLEAVRQLEAYFAGELTTFDLPLAPLGTDYQRRVWQALCDVGHGETVTYSEIARRLGQPAGASRAVGLANGRNPIPVVIPCHRVIGANGTLTGYAGGLERKQVLLDLERPAGDRLF